MPIPILNIRGFLSGNDNLNVPAPVHTALSVTTTGPPPTPVHAALSVTTTGPPPTPVHAALNVNPTKTDGFVFTFGGKTNTNDVSKNGFGFTAPTGTSTGGGDPADKQKANSLKHMKNVENLYKTAINSLTKKPDKRAIEFAQKSIDDEMKLYDQSINEGNNNVDGFTKIMKQIGESHGVHTKQWTKYEDRIHEYKSGLEGAAI